MSGYGRGYEIAIDSLIRFEQGTRYALDLACRKLADTLGECPYSYESYMPCDCENECENDIAGCWADYFEQAASRHTLKKEGSMSELKPCPFCGGEAKAFYCEESGTFDVQCQVCGAIPYIGYRRSGMSPDEVIEAWNRRATDDPSD